MVVTIMLVVVMLVVMEVKEVMMTTVLVGMVVMVHSGGDGNGDDHNISGDRTGLGMVWWS